jgi:hypothetical protein
MAGEKDQWGDGIIKYNVYLYVRGGGGGLLEQLLYCKLLLAMEKGFFLPKRKSEALLHDQMRKYLERRFRTGMLLYFVMMSKCKNSE